jgi:hypothetical protein
MDAELQALIERANKWCEQAAKRTPEKNALVARALIEDLAAYAAPKLPVVGAEHFAKRDLPYGYEAGDLCVVTGFEDDGAAVYFVRIDRQQVVETPDFLRDFAPAGDA